MTLTLEQRFDLQEVLKHTRMEYYYFCEGRITELQSDLQSVKRYGSKSFVGWCWWLVIGKHDARRIKFQIDEYQTELELLKKVLCPISKVASPV